MTSEPSHDRAHALINSIKTAFPADAEPPANDAIVTCDCEECSELAAYFSWTGRYEHSTENLRYHDCAINLLNLDAFTYWLPAFMIAELEDPETADTIVDSLRSALSSRVWLSLSIFTSRQRDVIVDFLLECARRYDEPLGENEDETEATYRSAAEVVRKWDVV